MDIAILGGGIAGLAAAVRLRQLGWDPVVYERDEVRVRHGHGFILLETGLGSLAEFGLGARVPDKGHVIDRFVLRRPDGTDVRDTPFTGAMGFRRGEFMDLLEHAVPADRLRMGKRIAHVEWDAAAHRLRGVTFEDGERIEADLFVESVGKESAVRAAMHPERRFGEVLVRELVSHVHHAGIAATLGTRFLKYQRAEGGISMGMVPCGHDQIVWYLQFDALRHPFNGRTGPEKAAFARSLVGTWAEPAAELIERTDFDRSFVWNTSDLDPLPSLHGANVALIGDSAHPFLPFTSQGVNAALDDVRVLGDRLAHELGAGARRAEPAALERALAAYSAARLPEIARIVASGRELRERFLHPERFPDDGVLPISK